MHECGCGYDAHDVDDLTAHLGDALIPDDDTAPDGAIHAETDHAPTDQAPGKRACTCGFRADGIPAMDAHLLAAFTRPDGTGRDGRRHGGQPG